MTGKINSEEREREIQASDDNLLKDGKINFQNPPDTAADIEFLKQLENIEECPDENLNVETSEALESPQLHIYTNR